MRWRRRSVPDQVSRWVPRDWTTLGTDGFGRSDTRAELRRFFETDAAHVSVAVLAELAAEGSAGRGAPADAIVRHGLDPDVLASWQR